MFVLKWHALVGCDKDFDMQFKDFDLQNGMTRKMAMKLLSSGRTTGTMMMLTMISHCSCVRSWRKAAPRRAELFRCNVAAVVVPCVAVAS
jgi:hypothetical protein